MNKIFRLFAISAISLFPAGVYGQAGSGASASGAGDRTSSGQGTSTLQDSLQNISDKHTASQQGTSTQQGTTNQQGTSTSQQVAPISPSNQQAPISPSTQQTPISPSTQQVAPLSPSGLPANPATSPRSRAGEPPGTNPGLMRSDGSPATGSNQTGASPSPSVSPARTWGTR